MLKMIKLTKGLTFSELAVVAIIIGALATIGISHFIRSRERALNREADINLKLIASSEKMNKVEFNSYIACNNASEINQRFKLALPTNNPNWNYLVTGVTANTFVAKAGRTRDNNATRWCINQTTEQPFQAGCVFP